MLGGLCWSWLQGIHLSTVLGAPSFEFGNNWFVELCDAAIDIVGRGKLEGWTRRIGWGRLEGFVETLTVVVLMKFPLPADVTSVLECFEVT